MPKYSDRLNKLVKSPFDMSRYRRIENSTVIEFLRKYHKTNFKIFITDHVEAGITTLPELKKLLLTTEYPYSMEYIPENTLIDKVDLNLDDIENPSLIIEYRIVNDS